MTVQPSHALDINPQQQHRGNLVELLAPFNTSHPNNLLVYEVLFPVVALSFQHISVLNIKKQCTHIHTHNIE
jgi:hypothetical protein